MPGHITLRALLLAQFRHAGLLHLVANAAFLLLFGVYVEQRGHRLLYLTAVLTAGSLGMLFYTAWFGAVDSVVVGGSTLVSAAMGMFYVFFYHSRMRFLVWLPRKLYTGTRFVTDVRYSFPLFFLLAELVVTAAYGAGSGDQTAHAAHLIAVGFGMLFASIISLFRHVPQPLIYEGEAAEVHELQQAVNVPHILTVAGSMVQWNPENIAAREVACSAALRSSVLQRQDVPQVVKIQAHLFLHDHLATICAVSSRTGSLGLACQLLLKVPLSLNFATYLDRLGPVNVLKVADWALAEGHDLLAVRLYDLYLLRYPLSQHATSVETAAAEAVTRLIPSREAVLAVDAYLHYHPRSLLAPRLGAWLSNSERRTA